MYAHLFQNPLLAIAWRFKSAHWYQTLNQLFSCFFVPEILQIARQAWRPSVGPIKPVHRYNLFS